MSWDYEARVTMGLTGDKNASTEGGNGNVRNSRGEHNHETLATPNLAAVRNLHHGRSDYVGRHRAAE